MRIKIKSPDNNQKEGKKTFLPTIGSKMVRREMTADSTINCPFEGIREVLPTRSLTKMIITMEMIQLVTIEFVTGNTPSLNTSSETKLTPPPEA
jgi:hypothetical protein